jgi:hypothetical protein
MKTLAFILALTILWGCNNDDYSYISIRNQTTIPIYVLPYASEYSDGDWINPGFTDKFYSIGVDHLNGYEFFCVYYDSLIVYLKDHEEDPVKFYSDGTTINYDPALNPFKNPEMWTTRSFNELESGSAFENLHEREISEDYFSIDYNSIISLYSSDTDD